MFCREAGIGGPTITPVLSSGLVDSGLSAEPRAPAHRRGDPFYLAYMQRALEPSPSRVSTADIASQSAINFRVGPTGTRTKISLNFQRHFPALHEIHYQQSLRAMECLPFGSSNVPKKESHLPCPYSLAPHSIPPSASTSHSLARSFVRPSLRIRNTCSADVE